jgi:hypothetical protein
VRDHALALAAEPISDPTYYNLVSHNTAPATRIGNKHRKNPYTSVGRGTPGTVFVLTTKNIKTRFERSKKHRYSVCCGGVYGDGSGFTWTGGGGEGRVLNSLLANIFYWFLWFRYLFCHAKIESTIALSKQGSKIRYVPTYKWERMRRIGNSTVQSLAADFYLC